MAFSHLGITAVKIMSNAQALSNGVTAYSNSARMETWAGFAAVLITGNTSTVTITQQCSVDGTNWYDPQDENGNALGAIVSAFSASAQYVQFPPVVAKHIRLKYVPTGSGVITVDLIIVE